MFENEFYEYIIIMIIGCISGYIFCQWIFCEQVAHGPNSRDWRGKITEENGKCYEWDVDICICPLF
jgi:hypothetical protein